MNMKNIFILILFVFIGQLSVAQEVESKTYDEMLQKLLKSDVSEVDVEEAYDLYQEGDVVFIDTREKDEYDVSHIDGAIWVGYNNFKVSRLDGISKDTKIIAYCSVGLRSENITRKLMEKGFTDVSNLYGSIFEWVNQGNSVYKPSGKETHEVHTYNKSWSQWLFKGKKIYKRSWFSRLIGG